MPGLDTKLKRDALLGQGELNIVVDDFVTVPWNL